MASLLLTHSRIESFKRCRKRHFFEYEIGLRKTVDARALRMGSAYHAGLDLWKQGQGLDAAVAAARMLYQDPPVDVEPYDWEIEQETVAALLSGYAWRWQDSPLRVIASEQTFRLPVRNPETGAASTVWDLAGKIDGIVAMEDGRLAVLEHKLLSENLAQDSDWWRRLQMDHQVSIYVSAARALGFDVATVLYDVTRKPTIRPEAVPLVDGDGRKIVLDQAGQRVLNKNGTPRQTGDTALGYAVQTRPMSPAEWTEKLVDDIGQRPEFYFARVEVPRLDQDLDECQAELWSIQKTIREAQQTGRWFRTVSRDSCPWCAFFGLCSTKFDPSTTLVPEGFQYLGDVHPELTN